MTAHSRLFKQLSQQYQALQTSFKAQSEEMKKKEEEHKRALAEEKSEVTRLQRELDRVGKVKAKLKTERDTLQKERDTLKAGLAKRAESDKKIQTLIADAEAEVKTAKDDLAAHKAVSAKWLVDLASLNEDMTVSLPNFLFPFCSYPTHKDRKSTRLNSSHPV